MAVSVLILLVEDEPDIRDLVESALDIGGFSVATASRFKEAIAMLEADGADYQALISDVNLGGGKFTGWEIAKRARELNDQLPVIYMTGGNAHEWASKGVLVTKPFASAQIVTAVSQLLIVKGV